MLDSHDGFNQHDYHHATFFNCRLSKTPVNALPPRDGPIVPSNCKTHLTCQPVHPNRSDPWSSWTGYISDWFSTVGIVIAGSAVVIGGCLYGKRVIDKNRKKKRDARLVAEGLKPPSEGSDSEGDNDEDARGERG
jgi:hypothetical protein